MKAVTVITLLASSPEQAFIYSHSHSDKLQIGMAVYGNFGLALDYGDDWAGRYEFQSGTLRDDICPYHGLQSYRQAVDRCRV